jgi:hypothetical protein
MSNCQVWDTKITGTKGKMWSSSLNINRRSLHLSLQLFPYVLKILGSSGWMNWSKANLPLSDPPNAQMDLQESCTAVGYILSRIPSRSKELKYTDLEDSRFPITRHAFASLRHMLLNTIEMEKLRTKRFTQTLRLNYIVTRAWSRWRA